MFAKITRGGRMAGLMAYLAGPGRSNEHENPRVLAGSAGVEAWYLGALDQQRTSRVAKYLDRPAQVNDTKVMKGVYEQVRTGDRDAHGKAVMERQRTGFRDAHVYHVPLSLRAAEGQLSDAEWSQIAHEFMYRMGLEQRPEFDPRTGEQTQDQVRWAAVHHGPSAEGNDHVHLVVNMVRADGTKIDVHRDFNRAKQVCRELEDEFGLLPLRPNEYELARTYARREWEQQRRSEQNSADGPRIPWLELDDDQQAALIREQFGTDEEYAAAAKSKDKHVDAEATTKGQESYAARQALGRVRAREAYQQQFEDGDVDRPWRELGSEARAALVQAATPPEDPTRMLERRVRAAATAAGDEAEFVRRLRQQGLLVFPRFARGTTDVVEGYSVAARPRARGEQLIKRGGGRLSRDLTIERLRQRWPDSPQSAQAAVDEWRAVHRRQKPAAPGRETQTPGPEAWRQATIDVRVLNSRLARTPISDQKAWVDAAREASGLMAAWSTRVDGPHRAAFEQAASTLASSARTRRAPRRARPARTSAAGAALAVLAAAGEGPAAEAALVLEMIRLGESIGQMLAARGDALAAIRTRDHVVDQLTQVHAQLGAHAAPVTASRGGTAVAERRETAAEQRHRVEQAAQQMREAGLDESAIAAATAAAAASAGIDPNRDKRSDQATREYQRRARTAEKSTEKDKGPGLG